MQNVRNGIEEGAARPGGALDGACATALIYWQFVLTCSVALQSSQVRSQELSNLVVKPP